MILQRWTNSRALQATFRTVTFLLAVSFATWATAATILTIRTSDGNGADTELREDESVQRGSAQDINTRREATPANLELIALRFDLTGVNRNLIDAASLELVVTRTGMPANNGLEYWGLNSNVAGQNWTEGQTGANTPWNAMNPFPGLTHDANLATLPINASDTTNLGTVSWATPAPAQGSTVAFSNTALRDFLKNGSGNLVTFFAFRTVATGTQQRYATKETEALGNTGSSGVPPTISPTYAPRLVLTLVPEPASIALLGLGGLALVGLARRRS